MALAIQAELKEIGINAQIEGVEQAAFMDVVLERENSPYDIMIGGYVMGIDPYAYASLFVSDAGRHDEHDELRQCNNQ